MLIYNFMFSILPSSPTGLAMSVLNRNRGFSENNVSSIILAPTFNRYHTRDMKVLRKKGLLTVPVNYMFDDLSYSDKKYNIKLNPVDLLVKQKDLTIISDKNSLIKRLFSNGKYIYYVKYTSNGKVDFIKHFSNQVFVDKISYYDDENKLSFEEYYFPESNSVVSKVYYDHNEKAFLRYLYKRNGDLYNIIHFPSDNTFSDEQELVYFWLSNILPNNKNIMLISEYAVYKKALLKVKQNLNEGSKLIFTLHNNHYDTPYMNGSSIRKDFRSILYHLDDIKNVVVLTNEQKEDLINQFGHPDSFFCVPHAAPQFNDFKDMKRVPYTVTVGSRFVKIKGIEDTIKAFSQVIKQIPNAHLNIIGKGSEKDNYINLINELGIESNCSVLNFVSNLSLEYAKSDISVFTSYYEGFHLSLIEAMNAGAVPVVFPYKYGPKDIIENGRSGIITREKDIDELADGIVDLLNDREKLNRMRVESMKVSGKFSVEYNVEHWKNVFSEAK